LLASSAFFLLGEAFLEASPFSQESVPGRADLPEELTPGELELVSKSVMAKDVGNFLGKGYGCAESGLLVGIRYLKKPEDLVWLAGGFNGGLGHRDLCGFLTGGVMTIGLYAGMLQMDKTEARKACGQKVREFWDWWTSSAPLRCGEIRKSKEAFRVCERLGRLATARLEELITPV